MIASSLLRNHHYKGQLSTTEPGSTFEHYKNPIEIEQRGVHYEFYDHSLSLSLSPSLPPSKGIYSFQKSNLSFEGCVRTTHPDIFVQGSIKPRFWYWNGSFLYLV